MNTATVHSKLSYPWSISNLKGQPGYPLGPNHFTTLCQKVHRPRCAEEFFSASNSVATHSNEAVNCLSCKSNRENKERRWKKMKDHKTNQWISKRFELLQNMLRFEGRLLGFGAWERLLTVFWPSLGQNTNMMDMMILHYMMYNVYDLYDLVWSCMTVIDVHQSLVSLVLKYVFQISWHLAQIAWVPVKHWNKLGKCTAKKANTIGVPKSFRNIWRIVA